MCKNWKINLFQLLYCFENTLQNNILYDNHHTTNYRKVRVYYYSVWTVCVETLLYILRQINNFSSMNVRYMYCALSAPHCKHRIPKIWINIPRKGIARPQSQFPDTFMCLWAIFIFPGSVFTARKKRLLHIIVLLW